MSSVISPSIKDFVGAPLPEGVQVSEIKPSIGVHITGYEFDGVAVADDFRTAMRDQLHNRGLLLFEPGTMTAENFTTFAGCLG